MLDYDFCGHRNVDLGPQECLAEIETGPSVLVIGQPLKSRLLCHIHNQVVFLHHLFDVVRFLITLYVVQAPSA